MPWGDSTQWTDDRIEILKQIYLSGSRAWVTHQINQQTGSKFSRNAIIGKIGRLGLAIKKPAIPIQKHKTNGVANINFRKRLRAPAVPLSVQEPLPSPLPFLSISLMDLTDSDCRYPQGDPVFYCGQPKLKASSYCTFHHRVCYTPLTAFQQKPKYQQDQTIKYFSGLGR